MGALFRYILLYFASSLTLSSSQTSILTASPLLSPTPRRKFSSPLPQLPIRRPSLASSTPSGRLRSSGGISASPSAGSVESTSSSRRVERKFVSRWACIWFARAEPSSRVSSGHSCALWRTFADLNALLVFQLAWGLLRSRSLWASLPTSRPVSPALSGRSRFFIPCVHGGR